MIETARIGKRELPVEVNSQTGRARAVKVQQAAHSRSLCRVMEPRLPSPYRSKTETRYAQHLDLLKQAGEITDWWYEPASLRLEEAVTGRRRKRHTPDFWVWQADGTLKIVAVKGVHRNLRDSLTLIRWAAQRYTFAQWVVVRWADGQWVEGLLT